MELIYKEFESEIKAIDEKNLIVEHFITTETKDRMGDIVRADGMKIRGRPVVLWAHGRDIMGREPIAKPLSIKPEKFKNKDGLLAKTQFYPDETGQRLFAKATQGYCPSWSIGFMIIRSKDIDGGMGRDIKEWELLEYSLVPVPANPDAQTPKDAEGELEKVCFKILADDAECGCGGDCKGPVKCAGHKESQQPAAIHPCPSCKAEMLVFSKDGADIGMACEKCQPQEVDRLKKALEEEPIVPATNLPAAVIDQIKALMAPLQEQIASLSEQVKALAPAPPASPDPANKGGDDPPLNPPEPAKLVFTNKDKDAQEAAVQARQAVILVVRGAMQPILSAEADRILGKVH